jgi:hypothetical protein
VGLDATVSLCPAFKPTNGSEILYILSDSFDKRSYFVTAELKFKMVGYKIAATELWTVSQLALVVNITEAKGLLFYFCRLRVLAAASMKQSSERESA